MKTFALVADNNIIYTEEEAEQRVYPAIATRRPDNRNATPRGAGGGATEKPGLGGAFLRIPGVMLRAGLIISPNYMLT